MHEYFFIILMILFLAFKLVLTISILIIHFSFSLSSSQFHELSSSFVIVHLLSHSLFNCHSHPQLLSLSPPFLFYLSSSSFSSPTSFKEPDNTEHDNDPREKKKEKER
jgi:hypothetical protein